MTGSFLDERGGRDVGSVGLARLRAFVALCEIHWRSFWLWRGGVLARYGRGPTAPLACGRGILVGFPTFRHAELVSASYFLSVVGSKILKQVQDDGGCCQRSERTQLAFSSIGFK